MEPWQQRVIDEQRELRDRFEKLDAMLRSDRFDQISARARYQLSRQHYAMRLYDEVLRERIVDFEEA